MAVEYPRGASGSVRHCAGGLSVSVRAERDTLSTFLSSEPPSRYNVPCVMAADINTAAHGESCSREPLTMADRYIEDFYSS